MHTPRWCAWGVSVLAGCALFASVLTPSQALANPGQNGTTLSVTKSATAHNELTYPWTITKTVTPGSIDMFEGDTATVDYTVTVTRGEPVANTYVTGEICVYNGGAVATENLKIDDVVFGLPSNKDALFTLPVDVSAKPVLQPYESFCYVYEYSISAAAGSSVKDTAKVTITNHSGWLGQEFGASPSATAVIPAPTTYDASVNVVDSNGLSWVFDGSDSVTYPTAYDAAGVYDNTATILETEQSASASVTVNTYLLGVSKTAGTSWDRDWTWTIDKSVTPTSLTLTPGQVYGPVNWTVTVAPTSADSGYTVAGTVTVTNPAPIAASLVSVTDTFGDLGITLDCPSLSVPANGTLDCSYSQAVAGPLNGTNVATAIQQNHAYASNGTATPIGTTPYQGQADVAFSSTPTTETDECVLVTDTLQGTLGTACQGDATKTFNYQTSVGPYDQAGTYTVHNVATFVTNDTQTTGNDDASVVITVTIPQITGCTLTQGYWKTHSLLGPAPYDSNWGNLGPAEHGTAFYSSGRTWYQVFWTPPGGNKYYNLAHQYMAAKLNVLNGAATTPQVVQALADAEALFKAITGTTLTKAQATTATKLASTLDQYNNGLIGPGHCSE